MEQSKLHRRKLPYDEQDWVDGALVPEAAALQPKIAGRPDYGASTRPVKADDRNRLLDRW